MRTAQHQKTEWQRIDDAFKPKIKEILDLPQQGSISYLYGSTNDGLFGIPLAGEDSDIAHIETAFKLLSSED